MGTRGAFAPLVSMLKEALHEQTTNSFVLVVNGLHISRHTNFGIFTRHTLSQIQNYPPSPNV